jgi:hypothetical protein
MGKDPDQLRREIDQTRLELGQDVDALNEKVNPARIVGRRTDRARTRLTRVRDRVMGSASDATTSTQTRLSDTGSKVGDTVSTATDKMSETASQAGDMVSSTASTVADTTREVPGMVRQRTEGNPLAAGLIAFGAGWLISSLLPATEAEKRATQAAAEKAEPLKESVSQEAREAAQGLRENLQDPAREAMESVKERATEAKDTVQGTATSAAQDVKEEGRSATQDVRQEATSSSSSSPR